MWGSRPRAAQLLRTCKNALLDLFFPRRCAGCGAHGKYLCERCSGLLRPLQPPLCRLCGAALDQGAACKACIPAPVSLRGLRSLYAYHHPLRDLLIQLKYQGVQEIAPLLGQRLGDYAQANALTGDIVTSVPLARERARERGYNQADLLATEFGEVARVRLGPLALRRIRNTTPQVKLGSRAERLQNVVGAFEADPSVVQSKRVLLIDDVATTGATINACANALLAAGARSVWGLTVAREV